MMKFRLIRESTQSHCTGKSVADCGTGGAAFYNETSRKDFAAEDVTMAKLWVANVEVDTTDDDIKAFLCGWDSTVYTIDRVTGTGQRPAVVLGFDSVEPHALRHLQPRVHAVFWKDRTLTVHVRRNTGHH